MNYDHAMSRDEFNGSIGGRIHISDCSQVTDGAAAMLLASPEYAKKWADRVGVPLESIPRIKGWGHNTARIRFEDKIARERELRVRPAARAQHGHLAPEARRHRRHQRDRRDRDPRLLHHLRVHGDRPLRPHRPRRELEGDRSGRHRPRRKTPINPSGGLIGAGHPVGATGVRQVLDCHKQVTGTAGDYQVEGAKNVQTLNIGGSGTTSVSFIIGT